MSQFASGMLETGVDPVARKEVLRNYWLVVSWASALKSEPIAVELLDERIVLWRDQDGSAQGAYDCCPHRGTQLSLGLVDDSGCLVCPYHGWAFDGDGKCTTVPQLTLGTPIPKRVRLNKVLCEESAGMIWVSLGEPKEPIPSFPFWEDSGFRHVECAPYTWQCSAERMVENFMDFGHLGYLHDGLLGTKDDLIVPDHQVSRVGNQLRFDLTMMVPSTTDSFAVTQVLGDRGKQTNTYVVTGPYTIFLQSHYHDTGANRVLFFSVQPCSFDRSVGYCYQSRDFDLLDADEPFEEFQAVLAEQDRPIVESQLPVAAPLTLSREVHLSFDRVAVAYRRLLSSIFATQTPSKLTEINGLSEWEDAQEGNLVK